MWSLNYDGGQHVFGQVLVTKVSVGGRVYRTDDTPLPYGDGITFGTDFADAGDVKLELIINQNRVKDAALQRELVRAEAFRFLEFWDAAVVRSSPGRSADLVIPELGAFVGRPRRAEWDWETYRLGYLRGTATFVRSSSDVYEVDSSGTSPWLEETVGLVPAQLGGLVAPLAAPLSTAAASSRARSFTVGGTKPAFGIYTVRGPLQAGGQVELVGKWVAKLNRGLAYDAVAVIDTRPGHERMTVNGRPVNLLLPSGAVMSEMFMEPGPQAIALRGTSLEGTASVSVRWRNTRGA